MRRLSSLLLLALLTASAAAGEAVFQADFNGPNPLAAWSPQAGGAGKIVPGRNDSPAVFLERPASEGPGYRSIRIALPVEKLAGTRVRVDALIKAEAVAKPPAVYNGVKVMLHTAGPSGPRWSQQDNLFGTFDWKPVAFTAEVPRDIKEAWLVLGLEQTTGQAWFDDLRIAVVGRQRRPPTAAAAHAPAYKGHDLPRLRGTMISPNVTEEDLRALASWKANHVRWQLLWGGFPHSPADDGDLAAYDRWLESALAHLDRLLPVCEELGIRVTVDLHTPPGGRNDASECLIFKKPQYQEAFVRVWEKIARRYRGNKAVWGYDLANEPVEGAVPDGLLDWHALADKTARRVRAIDAEHAIILEPSPWGSIEGLEWFDPLDVPGVVYSVHMYQPFKYTHQGIYNNPTPVTYPGMIDGKQVDRRELRRILEPAVRYQRDYNVQLYLGEFSAIRWAPGAEQYLSDVIEIFEENGWDWAYHAFREWDGWSVEHGPDRGNAKRLAEPTARQKVLRAWFEKNQR